MNLPEKGTVLYWRFDTFDEMQALDLSLDETPFLVNQMKDMLNSPIIYGGQYGSYPHWFLSLNKHENPPYRGWTFDLHWFRPPKAPISFVSW